MSPRSSLPPVPMHAGPVATNARAMPIAMNIAGFAPRFAGHVNAPAAMRPSPSGCIELLHRVAWSIVRKSVNGRSSARTISILLKLEHFACGQMSPSDCKMLWCLRRARQVMGWRHGARHQCAGSPAVRSHCPHGPGVDGVPTRSRRRVFLCVRIDHGARGPNRDGRHWRFRRFHHRQ